MNGFEWPTEDPTKLTQDVTLIGKIGETVKAPFWIKGNSNFATGKISFDLRGDINYGDLLDYRALWEGLPVEVTHGSFSLRAHVICIQREISSENALVLRQLKVEAGKGIDIIWGLPMKASIGFMQSQETIILQVPVYGNITDPEFGFGKASRKAFQEALREKTGAGVRNVIDGTAKLFGRSSKVAVEGVVKESKVIVNGTKTFVSGTSHQLVRGVEKMKDIAT